MNLHAVIFLAGVFLAHSAQGKPQSSQPLVARGSNVYGAGSGFNPGPFQAVPRRQPIPTFRQERLEQPLVQQALLPVRAPVLPAPAPAPVEVPRAVPGNDISGAIRPPTAQQTPLEQIDLRVTDLTTGGRRPVAGRNDLSSDPSAGFAPPRPQVVGGAGQTTVPERRPTLDNVFNGLPPSLASPNGGEIGVGVIGRRPETVVAFERNSAQAGGEAPSYGSGGQREESVVARGGDTYGAGQSVEVPRPPVSGDLDIRPPQPRTKEDVLSQAALPDSEAQPPLPPRQDDGEGHHMGGIEWLPESIPGEPLVDYPVLVRVPESGFDCANQEYDGFFADTSSEARCQAFWVCHNKQQDGFLCPNGTMFNQRYFTCDWWFNVRCQESPDYYELNKNIGVVGTRIDTLPAGVVAAESKVHPVFTLLSEMLHYPRVPPVLPHKLRRNHTSLPSFSKLAEDLETSIRIIEKAKGRQPLRLHDFDRKTAKSLPTGPHSATDVRPQSVAKSQKRAVLYFNERERHRRRGKLRRRRRRRRRRQRVERQRSRSTSDLPGTLQNPNARQSLQGSSQGLSSQANQSSQSAAPEPYIETVQKIDLPMSASGSPKLIDDVTLMEKMGNITLSQAEKQIPLDLSVPKTPASGQTNGQTQQAQDQSLPQGAPGQASSLPGNPALSLQTQPTGQPPESTPVQRPVQPQDQPPPPQGPQQPGNNQNTDGVVVDEDVKVEDGGSPPVEKKLHFPPAPDEVQSGDQTQANSGANSANGTDGNRVSIDEDIKVDEGDAAHPVEEELRYPPGGRPVVLGGSGSNSSLNNPANVRDPSGLHHDMPSESAAFDDHPITKIPNTNNNFNTEDRDTVQIISETVSKMIENPKRPTVRDPSGMVPPKSGMSVSQRQKKSSDQTQDSNHSKTVAEDITRSLGNAGGRDGKQFPEVRVIGNLHPVTGPNLLSNISNTVDAVDERLQLQPKETVHGKTYDAGTFYISPQSKNSVHGEASGMSSSMPIGVNLKIFVSQRPTNASNQTRATSNDFVQPSTSVKNRRNVEPVIPFVADAYDYDISELPSWMQKAAAVKRSAGSPLSSANLPLHDQDGLITAVEAEQSHASMQVASRPVRKVTHIVVPQSDDMKRALALPRVRKIFQSAREKLMKLLGGPEESLDSEIDSLLGRRQSDKGKRQNDMKLRLDSSSLTSYPEQGLDPL